MDTPDSGKFDLGRLVSTVANLGVLIGLLLVAVQISQSTDIARAQLANDYYLADMQLELSMMGESPVGSWKRAVHTPDDISQRDAAVLDRFFNYGLVQVRRLQQMQQLGLAESEVLDQQIRYLEWHLGNEVGRRWWAQYKVEEPEDEIVRMIDKVLSTTDYDQNRRYVEALMKSEPAQVKPD
ncbi:MAG: hypothetical protein E6Q99_08150 [Elusimicrobia bacterium]|nr:MAG: hypothetical protein EYC71_02620 [Gammaproteobacteria bacterium]TXH23275.1 MAG: hypothetical protein E6Q99_08150 [Elusimicrobiota bacterium]